MVVNGLDFLDARRGFVAEYQVDSSAELDFEIVDLDPLRNRVLGLRTVGMSLLDLLVGAQSVDGADRRTAVVAEVAAATAELDQLADTQFQPSIHVTRASRCGIA